jgi:L-erythro-3,5-diaminohexanoate dehydrogenase
MKYAPFGVHRVIDPPYVLPQAARRLDPGLPARAGELVVDVERLQVDSVSFRQLMEEQAGDPIAVGRRIMEIVSERGKLENPVTGSGGVLVGRARSASRARGVARGERLVSLASLTLTPLRLEQVHTVDPISHQVVVEGHAILCAAFPSARLPDDFPLGVSLAAFDVSSAPAQLHTLLRPRDTVVVIGAGGASGLLSLAVSRERLKGGRLFAVDRDSKGLADVRTCGLADRLIEADASHPLECLDALSRLGGVPADVVVNTVNGRGTEMASVLLARPGGTVLLFSMATSFSDAALSGDGIGRETRMMVGIGYIPGQAELAIRLLRRHPELAAVFARRYG